jgi:hypothetical protein
MALGYAMDSKFNKKRNYWFLMCLGLVIGIGNLTYKEWMGGDQHNHNLEAKHAHGRIAKKSRSHFDIQISSEEVAEYTYRLTATVIPRKGFSYTELRFELPENVKLVSGNLLNTVNEMEAGQKISADLTVEAKRSVLLNKVLFLVETEQNGYPIVQSLLAKNSFNKLQTAGSINDKKTKRSEFKKKIRE